VFRFIGRTIRVFVIAMLILASMVSAVAALWTINGPPALLPRYGSPVVQHVFNDVWAFDVFLNRFRDTTLNLVGRPHRLWFAATFQLDPANARTIVVKDVGSIRFTYDSVTERNSGNWVGKSWSDMSEMERSRARLLDAQVSVDLPAWLPAPLFAAYPLWAFLRGPWRRRRRRAKGLCVGCGYDLTGNVTGVCSECGTATASPPTDPSHMEV